MGYRPAREVSSLSRPTVSLIPMNTDTEISVIQVVGMGSTSSDRPEDDGQVLPVEGGSLLLNRGSRKYPDD